jgi:hemolysin activation/secretion protein
MSLPHPGFGGTMSLGWKSFCVGAPALAFSLFGSSAGAQIAPNLPSNTAAPTREEIDRAPVAAVPPPTQSRVTVEGGVERAPCPLADPSFGQVTLSLTAVEFPNLTAVSPDTLRSAYAGYLGKTVPIATVCEIRDRAATILRSKGYIAAVQVPPQKIEGGVVKFDVLMAKLVGFQVRGAPGNSEGIIARYLKAIQDKPVFNIVEAERYLLLARDLPGYDVRLTLRPAGTVPGEVIGEVQVTRTPVEAEINIQNYGSKSVGRFGGLAQVRFNGLLGQGDRTTIGYFGTADFKEQHVAQAAEEVRVGGNGLTLAANFTYAWTRPTFAQNFDLRSRTLVASLEARYPFIRRQSHNLLGHVGLELVNQRTRLGTAPLTEEKIRVAYVRLDYDSVDPQSLVSTQGYSTSEPRWRFGGSLELRKGLAILGASDRCTSVLVACPLTRGLPTDPNAFVARVAASAEYRPIPNITFSLSPRAQYAPHTVVSFESFSGGNFTAGRGYDPGVISGDSGFGIQTEIRFGHLTPKSQTDLAYQLYGFVDGAWAWNHSFDGNTPSNSQSRLYSAGGGVRFAYGSRATLDIGAAVPLRTSGLQTSRDGVRVLANLTVRLLPWNR